VRRLATDWVCFNICEKDDLDSIRNYFAGVDRCKTLPKEAFIAYNRDSGGTLAGRVF
jgi:hypothetical protein